MHRLLMSAAALAALAGSALAQCSNYSNSPAGTLLMQADDAIRTVALPFAFPFNGTTYDRIVISTNGWIKLGSTLQTSSELGETEALMLNNPIVTNNSAPRIAVCWDDLRPNGVGQGVYYAADAAQATICWVNAPAFSAATAFANCECVLMITGDIYLKYDASNNYNTNTSTSATPIVGISKSDGTVAAATHTFDWTLATPGPLAVVDATGYQQFTIATGAAPWDLLGGVVLHFAPTGVSTYDVTNTTLSTCPPATYPVVATASTAVGTACAYGNQSIYEAFTIATGTNPIDLSNTSMQYVRSGASYTLIPGPALDPNYLTNGTIQAGITDDSTAVRTLAMGSFPFGTTSVTQVTIGSNGIINLGSSTLNPLSSTPATFHGLTQGRIAGCNDDLVPNTTTAPIYVEDTATMFRATWHNVPFFGITGSTLTMQITLDQATGNISVAYGTITAAVTASPPIVGLSGIASIDGGASDLATAGVTNVVGPRTLTGATAFSAMSHTTTLAAIGQDFVMTTTCTANNFGFGGWLIGFTNPNVPVDLIFGAGQAPGCNIYSDFQQTLELLVPFTAGATSFSKTVPIPYNVSFAGIVIFTQAAVFAPANPLNVMTSNGRTQTVGL